MYDVIVAGAGSSGLCAAVAAAREGMRVLLMERALLCGGTNTLSLVSPLMGFTAGGKQAVGGIAQEIVDMLLKRGGTLGHIPDPLGVADTITPVDPEALKQVESELLLSTPGIDLLLGAEFLGAQVRDGRIQSVRIYTKAGEIEETAPFYIDATGDGDVAVSAGVPFTFGREKDHLAQPMTAIFRIRGVDYTRVRAYMAAHPDQFVLADYALSMDYTAVSGYFDLVKEARERGELTLPRDRVLLFQGVKADEALVNMSRVVLKKGTDPREMAEAELEGRRQIDEIMNFLRQRVDGFEHIELIQTGAAIGVRETRHIQGAYCLEAEDIIRSRTFPDAVAVGAFPIDIHDPTGRELYWKEQKPFSCYDVPYGTMLPCGIRNLLVTGRCISATHEAAASVRITPTAMALGQAAGTAAALAAERGGDAADMDISALRKRLHERGAIPGKAFMA